MTNPTPPPTIDTCGLLQCPECRGEHDYLHHSTVETFTRGEDAQTGTHYVITPDDRCYEDDNLFGNPSPRRDGIRIHFTCENCDLDRPLWIYQHKGQTFIEWGHHPTARHNQTRERQVTE